MKGANPALILGTVLIAMVLILIVSPAIITIMINLRN